MTKKLLLDDDGPVAFDDSFKVNNDYAKRYEERKRKQELGQLEDKYKAKLAKKGIIKSSEDYSSEESDSESDEEEDEFGEQLTPAVDAQILKTLSEIRSGSAKIYDPSVDFFSPAQLEAIEKEWRLKHGESNKAKIARNEKPVTLKDYHREVLLSGAYARDDDDEPEPEPEMTHVQEQEALKSEIRAAFKASSDEDEDDEDGLFKKRPRSAEEIAREEEDYRNFLLENLATADNAKESMSDWLNYRAGLDSPSATASAQSKDDAFLIDYVLNKGWMDRSSTRLPSYDQIVAEASASEEELDRADEYEAALNFRFEQEGGAQIQTYARTVEGSLRRPDTKRKDQREAAKQRKAEEKARKAEELKRLKNLKLAEIRAKLEKIQKVAKAPVLPEDELLEELADGDFDGAKHDALMAKIAQNVSEGIDDDEDLNEKPVFSDLSDDDEDEAAVSKKPVKKARKVFKSILKDSATNSTNSPNLAAALEELYQLDYEDLIGDIPCRFKYQRVEPSTFGLKVDDILAADDSQLNKYFALKKLAPYRPAEVMQRDVQKYATSKRLREFRKNVKYGEERMERIREKDQNKKKKSKKDE